jgi:hypothetical protein
VNLLTALLRSEDVLLFSACVAWMKNEAEQLFQRVLRSITDVNGCAISAVPRQAAPGFARKTRFGLYLSSRQSA